MARRRVLHQIDTSDRLANVVVASIATLIVALLGLILWMTGTGQQTSEQTAGSQTPPADAGSATPSVPPVVAATPAATEPVEEAPVPATEPDVGQPTDQVTAPSEAASPADLPPAPPAEGTDQPTAPAPDSDADVGGRLPPNSGRGTGLYSMDDPDRMPAITVNSTPRGERLLFVDLNADGIDERVRAAIVADQVVTRVDRNIDGVWEIGRTRGAAAADRLVDLRAEDLTGDGRPELYTRQWVATQGESVTLWSYADGDLQRMPVSGGCWSGNNTVGIIGAEIERRADGEWVVIAICNDKPLPPQQWSSALYRWRDGRWTFDRLLGTYE